MVTKRRSKISKNQESKSSKSKAAPLPEAGSRDETFSLLRESYGFISARADRLGSDCFQTRLLGEPVICLRGEAATKLFYNPEHFIRHGAAPSRLNKTLFGEGGVQGLDGEDHAHRKAVFMACLDQDAIGRLVGLFKEKWRSSAERWMNRNQVDLHRETQKVLYRAVVEWMGLPLVPADVEARSADMNALVEGGSSLGLRYLRARRARKRNEAWIIRQIEDVRHYRATLSADSIFAKFVFHRDTKGKLLSEQTLAVELLNLIRPTVAIARYIVFCAHALDAHPNLATEVRRNSVNREAFIHEVRRFYPFIPFVAARVRDSFTWHGRHFPEGTRTLLDLYGTNHDKRIWSNPEQFDPSRFDNSRIDPFRFIPQGGGDHFAGHRCAGEWVTIAIMQSALEQLTERMEYEVLPKARQLSFVKMPPRTLGKFFIRVKQVRSHRDLTQASA